MDPKNRDRLFDEDADCYIVHWDVLRLMPELAEQAWMHVIADECHRAQSRKALMTQALKKIPAYYKTGLSGTWITNTPDKAWSILNWLYPKDFTSYWRFFGKFVECETTIHGYRLIKGPKNSAVLHDKIGPFYVRHRKKDRCCPHHPNGVLPELPDKYYTDPPIYVDLHPQQKRAYDEMRKTMLAWVGDQEDKPVVAPVVVAQLTRLQQFANAYATINTDGSLSLAEPSSKLDAMMDFLEDTDEQIVVFSQFAQMIRLLDNRLTKRNIPHGILIGATPEQQRRENIRRFQNGDLRVFAGSIQAGGVGITLTAASTVVFLDRSWSPALNEQAEDRLHRIGQPSAVQVVDIVARGTVDLGRKQRLVEKWAWLREVLGDTP